MKWNLVQYLDNNGSRKRFRYTSLFLDLLDSKKEARIAVVEQGYFICCTEILYQSLRNLTNIVFQDKIRKV